MPVITVFARSPDGGRGLARDMRVRWALEEVGQAYDVRPVSFDEMKEPAHLARHPFGQIPTYEDDGLVLFESGAIVFHIAQCHPGLLPDDAPARARAIAWMFSALSTVEPPIIERDNMIYMDKDLPGHAERLLRADERIGARLAALADRLGDSEWLDGAFSAGDLMMVEVLRRVQADRLAKHPTLGAYVARGKARAAFRRAFAAQRELFEAANKG